MEALITNEAAARRHDRLAREIEQTTGRETSTWFLVLDRARARRKGLPGTINYLSRQYALPHQLASVLAWNYFNPSTLPCDLVKRMDARHSTREVAVLHPGEVRPARRRSPRRPPRPVARRASVKVKPGSLRRSARRSQSAR